MFHQQNLWGLLCPIRQLVWVAFVAWFPLLASLFSFITPSHRPFICPPCSLTVREKNKWMSALRRHSKCMFWRLWRCTSICKLLNSQIWQWLIAPACIHAELTARVRTHTFHPLFLCDIWEDDNRTRRENAGDKTGTGRSRRRGKSERWSQILSLPP